MVLSGGNYKFNESGAKSSFPDFASSLVSLPDLEVNIFPNPFIDHLSLEGVIGLRSWQLYDISGKLLLSGEGSRIESGLNEVTSGAYVLIVKSEDGVGKRVLVKE